MKLFDAIWSKRCLASASLVDENPALSGGEICCHIVSGNVLSADAHEGDIKISRNIDARMCFIR